MGKGQLTSVFWLGEWWPCLFLCCTIFVIRTSSRFHLHTQSTQPWIEIYFSYGVTVWKSWFRCISIRPKGVVTYMSHVETFVTGIKIEKESRSRDQGNFQTANIKDQECVVPIQPLTCKTKRSRSFRRGDQAHFVDQKFWSWSQTLQQATYRWLW